MLKISRLLDRHPQINISQLRRVLRFRLQHTPCAFLRDYLPPSARVSRLQLFIHNDRLSITDVVFQAELTEIVDLKKKLLALNVAVHRFITENKDYNASSLKIDVSELYSIWNEFHSW